jgi:hypothetical protein
MTCAAQVQPVPDTALVRTPRPEWLFLPQVAGILAAKYRATQTDSLSLEYAACLDYVAQDRPDGSRFYLIVGVAWPADERAYIERDPTSGRIVNYRVGFSCATDEIPLHTHSYAHCLILKAPSKCTRSEEWREPSSHDRYYSRALPLSFIQYSERSVLAYVPDSVPAWTLRAAPTRKRP